MKNKKGFTLIELLAVIVVLAIIALIATPIVMNTIKKSKKGAAERSADSYVKQVEVAVAEERLRYLRRNIYNKRQRKSRRKWLNKTSSNRNEWK